MFWLTLEHEISDLIGRYEEYISNREDQIIDLDEDILANGKRTIVVVGVISILVILISMAIVIISANSISKPLSAVTDRMKVIAKDNLSNEPLQTNLRDKIGQLIQSTTEMSEITRGYFKILERFLKLSAVRIMSYLSQLMK